ncbi:FUSC family protein [Sarcina ventriculi]|uniref:FUSC family protein n=1 Tax=Sarcina ventriculi TaxID=1267 RepID=UPI0018AB9819|nr:FUSC family protein [Sarcina ventriculi]
MNKKVFMANNIIFIISVIFVYMSIVYLGRDNLMVGITGIFLLIAIINKDFSRNPLRAIFKISFLTAFIAFMPYLVNLNIYSGLIINFLAVFTIIYVVVYTLNKTIYFPFLFGYTLLLTTNVGGRDLCKRIIALVIIGIVAVIFQIVFSKITFKKNEKNKMLIEIIETFLKNINDLKVGNFNFKNKEKLKELSTYWSRDILEKRNNSFYLKDNENIKLNLIAAIEKLDRVLEEISQMLENNKEYIKFIEDLGVCLENLKLFLQTETRVVNLSLSIKKLNNDYESIKIKDIKIYEAIEALNIIDGLTSELLEIGKKDYIEIKFGMKEIKEIKNLLWADFNKNSVRFIFAFRTAILISVSYFVIECLHLELGKWMMFTIASVSQPYNDTVWGRAKGRILGTLVGVIIYLPLSYIVTSVEYRIIIIAIAVYFMISFKKYSYSMSMLTVLFLGVVTINIPNIFSFAEDRVLFVALGVVIVLLGNRFILPYSLKKETIILIDKYYNCCTEILDKTLLLYKKSRVREEIRNLIIIAKGIENKILLNNTDIDSDTIREFRNESRRLLKNINSVLNRVEYIDRELKSSGYERMNNIALMREEMENKLEEENLYYILDRYIKPVKKVSEKLIYIDVYEMIISKNICEKLKNELIKKKEGVSSKTVYVYKKQD